MKETRTCPKCESKDIIVNDGTSGAYGTGNNIKTGISHYSFVKVNRYVCCKCGFTEEWVDKWDIGKLQTSGVAHR